MAMKFLRRGLVFRGVLLALACGAVGACGSEAQPGAAAAVDAADATTADTAGGTDTSAGSDSTSGADAAGSDAAGAETAAGGDAGDSSGSGDADSQADTQADSSADASGKATPWGPISGQCGGLTAELSSQSAAFVVNTWHFDQAGPFDPVPLRVGAKKRYDGPNAGGSSKCSEVMSMQLMYECEGAITLKPEVEITYDTQGSIADWLASFGGVKVGVSVTRAYKGPSGTTYTQADADTLLTKKLKGILEARQNVSAADKWQKSMVHVWTLRPDWVPVLKASWDGLDPAIKADTIVVVTVEEGANSVVTDTCQ